MFRQIISTIALFASFLIMGQTVLAVTTGQVNYYDEETSSSESATSATSELEADDEEEETSASTKPSRVTTTKNVPKAKPTSKIRQSLLQTNDTVNYFFSLLGLTLILIGVYEIHKIKTFRRNTQ